ncbi:hypothetical protein EJ04DRAFT_572187 [Polyplosphaeria fusca]|uniref:Uncharacterized protein n=1 Tax=Polyplosphaeria fusca TaxID=682080 RepID=A0A9P4V885_9PLEO|nr:hypothetical protein EJ04DRAFT_572187 [Polyplosphaeria fusca]
MYGNHRAPPPAPFAFPRSATQDAHAGRPTQLFGSLSQHSRSTSVSSTRSARQPSPIHFPIWACWTCSCGACHKFTLTSAVRPLGRLTCYGCRQVAKYLISLPPLENGPPKTHLGHVCCKCGRSHLRVPKEVDGQENLSENSSSHLPSKMRDARDKFWRAFKRMSPSNTGIERPATAPSSPKPNIQLTGLIKWDGSVIPIEQRPEITRKVYSVSFDKECTCSHAPCGLCIRFKYTPAESEDEWITQMVERPSSQPKYGEQTRIRMGENARASASKLRLRMAENTQASASEFGV